MGPPGTVLDWTPDGSGWSRLVPLRQPMWEGCGKPAGRATGPRPSTNLEVHHGLAHRRISVCLFAVTCPELQAGDAPVLNRPQRATSSRIFTPFGCTNRCTDGMVTAMARGGKQIQSRVPWRMTSATLK